MMSNMRTTLTLDSDVAERLRQETASGKLSLKQVVNDRLRKGYGLNARRNLPAFKVEPHASAYIAGVDRAKLNQLVDELEAGAFGAVASGK